MIDSWPFFFFLLSPFHSFRHLQAPAKAALKQKIAKPMKVNAPRVGGKR